MNQRVNGLVDEDILSPDPDNLDEEWVKQPRLYFHYAAELAQARREWEEAKAELKVVEADLARDIRERPSEYELGKVTEAAVKELVPLQNAHAKAVAEVTTSRYKVDILEAAVTALDHRKKALENLVYLHGQGYYSAPRVDQERVEDEDAVTDMQRGSARKKGMRRPK